MTSNALRSISIAATVFVLGVFVAANRDSVSQIFSGRAHAFAAHVATGEHVWQTRSCSDCHSLLGTGGNRAPDLTTVIARRDSAWLARWLADPQAVRPATTMPNQQLGAADVTGLVAFFRWVNSRLDAAPDSATGAALFQQKGCTACHRIGGRGPALLGPDLSRIGSTPYDGLPNTPEFLAKWLENPQAQKPGTMMPRLPLTPTEREALVRYLTSLQ